MVFTDLQVHLMVVSDNTLERKILKAIEMRVKRPAINIRREPSVSLIEAKSWWLLTYIAVAYALIVFFEQYGLT